MIWDMSNVLDEVCERIVKAGLHVDILKNLGWETLSATSQSSAKREVVTRQINILHNLVRKNAVARDALRRAKAIDVVQKFRCVKEYEVTSVFKKFFSVTSTRPLPNSIDTRPLLPSLSSSLSSLPFSPPLPVLPLPHPFPSLACIYT